MSRLWTSLADVTRPSISPDLSYQPRNPTPAHPAPLHAGCLTVSALYRRGSPRTVPPLMEPIVKLIDSAGARRTQDPLPEVADPNCPVERRPSATRPSPRPFHHRAAARHRYDVFPLAKGGAALPSILGRLAPRKTMTQHQIESGATPTSSSPSTGCGEQAQHEITDAAAKIQ